MAEENPRLYVGNLPYTAQKTDVEELFAKNGIQVYVTNDEQLEPGQLLIMQ